MAGCLIVGLVGQWDGWWVGQSVGLRRVLDRSVNGVVSSLNAKAGP